MKYKIKLTLFAFALTLVTILGYVGVPVAEAATTSRTYVAQSGTVSGGASGVAASNDGGFVPCGNKADEPCTIHHLFKAFVVIVNYLITTAGFVAILAIVYAGFLMVISQGEDKLKEAKGRISGAIIGLVLVASAFVLINAIFAGSLSVGVRDGANILSNPLQYIRGF